MNFTTQTLYKILQEKFGKQKWWPIDRKYHREHRSDPRFEIIVGTILTQNTAWSNVEKVLANLKSSNLLEIEKIADINIVNLQNLIKSSGFFNQKAQRLKNIAILLHNNYQNDLDIFFNRDFNDIRKELLSINGIGPETADSILLYSGNKPVFVVDAYTKRICKRIPLEPELTYEEIQKYFEEELSKKYSENEIVKIYNELHALIVILAKNICKNKPECMKCPLQIYCKYRNQLLQ